MPLSKLAQSIRSARLAARLTQEALGRRLGLKGRAVYRWERDEATPSKRNLAALDTALRAVDTSLADWLRQQIAPSTNQPAAPAPPPVDELAVVQHAVYTMADELDLPPRRVRHALRRLIRRLNADRVTPEVTEKRLTEWIESSS